MTAAPDVVVVGGGAAGAAAARELARTGRRVALVEPDAALGAAWSAAAGMLAPQIEARENDDLYDLGIAGREQVAAVAEALAADGHDVGLWREGILHLAQSEAAVAELRTRVSWQRQLGYVADWLDGDEVHTRWPWLGPSFGALFAPREGAVDPHRWVQALRADAVHHGTVIVRASMQALLHDGDRVTGVRTDAGEITAGAVVLAAGAWSATLAGLPRPLALAPILGQMAAFAWPTAASRCIAYGDQGYVVWRNGEAICGSTMEYNGFDIDGSAAGRQRVLASAVRLLPSLAGETPLRTWSGLRPVTADGLPIVGAEPSLEGLWYATGGGRNGILFSAILGRLVRELIDRDPVDLDIAPFSPARFWRF